MSSKQRTRFSPEQKIVCLKRHLLEHVPVSEVCDQAGIHPTVFYRWQKQLFERGAATFQNPRLKTDKDTHRIQVLERKIQAKNEVLAELMEVHVALRKELGEL
jgi:transposase-like protein